MAGTALMPGAWGGSVRCGWGGDSRGPFADSAAVKLRSSEPSRGWRWSFLLRRAETDANGDVGQSDVRRTPKLARLEAVLLVAEGALSSRKLAQFALAADAAEVRTLIDRLNDGYDRSGSAFRIERVSTGYQMLTRPEFAPWLDRLHQRQRQEKLSSPAMETLCIIAYRQPITRADVEAIRGVQCTEILKQLMERGLVKIAGEDESLGRPYLYGTTRRFLERFGLRTLNDLPLAEQLRTEATPVVDEQPTDESSVDESFEDEPSEEHAHGSTKPTDGVHRYLHISKTRNP